MVGWILELVNCSSTINQAGEKVVCKGRVTAMRGEGGESLVECEVWVENAEGETSTTGSALVALSSRATG